MEFLGLPEVQIIILICISGVAMRTFMGMEGKKLSEFNFRYLFSTFVIGLLTSIGIVGAAIQVLPNDLTATSQLIIIVGQIGTVIGADVIIKKSIPKLQNVGKKTEVKSE